MGPILEVISPAETTTTLLVCWDIGLRFEFKLTVPLLEEKYVLVKAESCWLLAATAESGSAALFCY